MTLASNDRWEHGSFMQWTNPGEPDDVRHPWADASILCASGRDAFRTVIEHGMRERGWRRLYVPCYYCQEVVESLVSTGIEVKLYANGPEDPIPHPDQMDLSQGDVLLRVCYFGLQGTLNSNESDGRVFEVIDDFSHDPWCDGAYSSDADWCVVSLRKTLPLPDGGVLWSPKGHTLPPQPRLTERHRLISLEKLAAMVLKSEYLAGRPVSKETYRRLAVSSEENLSQGHLSGMPEWTTALLDCMPALTWRETRRVNHQIFSQAISDIDWLRVLQPSDSSKSCPFTAILVMEDTDLHDRLRTELISRRVYPTTLWPLNNPAIDDIPAHYVDFSHRMLSIQCDARYTSEDMLRVAEIIRRFGAHAQKQPVHSLKIRQPLAQKQRERTKT